MRFFYHTFIYFMVMLPVVWLNIFLNSLWNTGLFLYSTIVILSVCMLKKSEAIFGTICLGLLIDSINFEINLWGISALLLSAPIVLFQNNSWKNIFKYRTYSWGFSLNIILQFIFIIVQFLMNDIPLAFFRGYLLTLVSSGVIAALLSKFLLKVQYKYLL